MNEVSKTRMVVGLTLVTIGCGLWLIPRGIGIAFGGCLICIGAHITRTAKERATLSRPLRGIDFLWISLPIFGSLAIGLLVHYGVANSFFDFVYRGMCHPAFAAALWILNIWTMRRKWKRANRDAQAVSI